ncbi:MAG: AMP-binding protein [Rhodoferax sp.]|nr:AMP-binding protein [Rhodoferax sp.]
MADAHSLLPPACAVAGRLIHWAAAQHGDRPSVVFRDRSFSHADMDRRSNQVAHALRGCGLQTGERLAVLLENSVESIDTVFGAEKAGLTMVALNARHTVAEHLAVLDDAQAAAVLIGPQFADLAHALAQRTAPGPLRQVLVLGPAAAGQTAFAPLVAAAPATLPGILLPPDHVARIAYTSGTTGQPKGIVYTQARTEQRLQNHFLAMEYGLSVDDAMLHVGPLTHAAGVYLFPCFLRGARNVVLDRFDPASLVAAIAQHRITHLMLVPTMMARLVDAIEGGLQGDWSSLRRIHYGTAPTPVALIRRAQAVFGPILRQQYGMTEAVQPLCVLYPHEHVGASEDGADDPIGSCGRPTAQVQLVLRDADGAPVPPGVVGEITLAHEGIGAVRYWNRPDLEADTVRKGWFHTGDLGRFDRHGFLHIVGRLKDMIISGGFNVYAAEVEAALDAHPAVLESAVLGLPDAEWGELVAAAVVLRPGARVSVQDLQAHCAARIAGYKKPRRILLLDALPRNGAGKVQKPALRGRFAAPEAPSGSTPV